MDFFKLLHGLSKLLHKFVKLDTWISLVLLVVTWICQSGYMDLLLLLFFRRVLVESQVLKEVEIIYIVCLMAAHTVAKCSSAERLK